MTDELKTLMDVLTMDYEKSVLPRKQIDAVPVVHGRNNTDRAGGLLCSVCKWGDFGLFRDYAPNYCPNCGADMRREVADKIAYDLVAEARAKEAGI